MNILYLTLNIIVQDREVGSREWVAMQNELPAYLIRQSADMYMPLSPLSTSIDGGEVDLQIPVQVEQCQKENELCIICMEELAVGHDWIESCIWSSYIHPTFTSRTQSFFRVVMYVALLQFTSITSREGIATVVQNCSITGFLNGHALFADK